ncbi:hypothetical protein EU91_1305 [Prochlorococcus marinus str. GP2]|uniref:Uncharacterized protein n=1 Tax=Prochlorococcus marinus str. GP2 TaxID=59925 RepID=A0A0A1ZE72_PROMR|nr:hypothetical protein EU91_1305 [Prochlorococcus marinus str. GP2]
MGTLMKENQLIFDNPTTYFIKNFSPIRLVYHYCYLLIELKWIKKLKNSK